MQLKHSMKREFEMSSSLSFEEILNEILRLEHYGFNSQKRSETAHGSSLVCVSHLFLEKIRASKIVSNPLLPLPSPLRLIRRPLLSTDHPGGQSTTRRLRDCISMMIDDAKDLSGECQRTVRLLELLQRTHYELVQVEWLANPPISKDTSFYPCHCFQQLSFFVYLFASFFRDIFAKGEFFSGWVIFIFR